MNPSTPAPQIIQGRELYRGKTKAIFAIERDPHSVILDAFNNLSAGDGVRKDSFDGKGALANATTCHVFGLLKECGLPVAFDYQLAPTAFVAPKCTMLPWEVIARRKAVGSYIKRYPHIPEGTVFPKLIIEFFLKTSGKKWKSHDLPCDDPFTVFHPEIGEGEFWLFDPKAPFLDGSKPFLKLRYDDVLGAPSEDVYFKEMEEQARMAFLILEKAFEILGVDLIDFKVEFGLSTKGQLLLADVIDCDSWRTKYRGKGVDKEGFRQGEEVSETQKKYILGEELTRRFELPTQRLIIWTGSPNDDVTPLMDALSKFKGGPASLGGGVKTQVCSLHKEPSRGYRDLHRIIDEVPNSVIVAFIGLSNGAGPMLAANCSVPVIALPTTVKEFPDDVWSSLRVPSNVPLMTILNPVNAVHAAFLILAQNNPKLYAILRYDLETRLENTVPV